MNDMNMERGDETARQQIDPPNPPPRGPDRRVDSAALFGGYQGPERRSGRDRRNPG
jgi:hypothetical protein